MSSTLNNNNVCTICNNGEMMIPAPLHTYDYSTEGFILKYCNNCFICNDVEEIIPDNNIILTRLSNGFIKKLLKILCNYERNFSYEQKNVLKDKLCNKNFSNPDDLADLLILEANDLNIRLNRNHVVEMIYSPFGANLCNNSWV